MTRKSLWRLGVLFFALGMGLAGCWFIMLRMPGRSHRGPLPPLTPAEGALASEIREDVETLAMRIGRRSTHHPVELAKCVDYITGRLGSAGYVVNHPGSCRWGRRL